MIQPTLLFLFFTGVREVGGAIWAYGNNDPGFQDRSGTFLERVAANEGKAMENVQYIANTPGAEWDGIPYSTVATDEGYDPPAELALYSAGWALDERPRNMALLVLDMQVDYIPYVYNAVPNTKRTIDVFRELGLPIFWTNWAKVLDKYIGGLDRFYGSTGISTAEQPMYLYGDREEGCSTMEELAPITDEEKAREIKSLHSNKFADKDAEGNEILMPLLNDLSIDTIVIVGSWSDVCVLFTALDAVDRYDLDVIVLSDAIATGTMGHESALFILGQGAAKVMDTASFVQWAKTAKNLPVPTSRAAAVKSTPRGALGGATTMAVAGLLVATVALVVGLARRRAATEATPVL